MKNCFKCKEEKPLDKFYKHPDMGDGRLNKCIDCCVKESVERTNKLRLDPEWLEKERERGREKYHRLNYRNNKVDLSSKKAAMKKYIEKFPEKEACRKLSSNMKAPKGMHKHHWSYNIEHAKDVVLLTPSDHAKAHRFIVYDQEQMMYRRIDNMELLYSKDSHVNYINEIINKC